MSQLKVGDVLYSIWGYDQQNVCFYKVVGLTKTGKSVKICRIGQRVTDRESPAMSEYVLPNPNEERGEITTHRIREYNGKPMIKLASYEYASPWDGKEKFQSFWH